MSYPINQPLRLTFNTYSDAARTTLADATATSLDILKPDGTVSTVTPTHGTTGVYTYDYTPATAGHYAYHFTATGTVATAQDGSFDVRAKYDPGLVDLASAKRALNMSGSVVTDDDELQDVVDAASAVLLNHPNYRVADAVALTEHTEWADGGTDLLVLQHYPISDVTSITEYTGTTSQAVAAEPLDGGSFTSYGWDFADGSGANGLLVRLASGSPTCWGGRRVKVVYTAGSASVPADIRDAALKLVKHLWRDQRGSGSGRTVPGENPEDAYLADTAPHLLPLDVEQALAPYKRDALV